MQIFKDLNGKNSSRRVWGGIYLALGILFAVLDQTTSYKITSYEVWIAIIVTGASLLGITTFGSEGLIKTSNVYGHPDPDKEEK